MSGNFVNVTISNKLSNKIIESENWGPGGKGYHFPFLERENDVTEKENHNSKPEIMLNSFHPGFFLRMLCHG